MLSSSAGSAIIVIGSSHGCDVTILTDCNRAPEFITFLFSVDDRSNLPPSSSNTGVFLKDCSLANIPRIKILTITGKSTGYDPCTIIADIDVMSESIIVIKTVDGITGLNPNIANKVMHTVDASCIIKCFITNDIGVDVLPPTTTMLPFSLNATALLR